MEGLLPSKALLVSNMGRSKLAIILTIFLYVCAALKLHPDLDTPQVPLSLLMSNTSVPNATAWVQSHLTALYEDTNVQDTFAQAFSPSCELRLNHELHSLQAFKDDLAAQRMAATQVSVAWDADIISTNDSKPEEPAIVAGALVVTRSLPFRIRVGPAQRLTHVHFSAKIERDANVQGSDQRRITSFYCTLVYTSPLIHLNPPHVSQEGGSDGQ